MQGEYRGRNHSDGLPIVMSAQLMPNHFREPLDLIRAHSSAFHAKSLLRGTACIWVVGDPYPDLDLAGLVERVLDLGIGTD
jgi:hypothetical protein